MTPSVAELRSARWVAALFLLVVLFQRFAIPGVPLTGLLVPIVLLWTIVALLRGVVELDRTRLTWWFAAAAVSAFFMLVQARFVPGAEVSITAWGLVMAVWLPFTVRMVERGTAAYLAMLGYVVKISTALAILAIMMIASQLIGIPYRDWFAILVPKSLQLEGFILTYPITYGSDIYKASGWIGLEPSVVSALIGLGLLAALFVRARLWVMAILLLGLVSTLSGSGIAIVVVGVLVMLFHRSRRLLVPFIGVSIVVILASAFTQFGQILLGRTTEFQSADSSTSLRALEPYSLLYPRWTESLSGMVLGYGPGSSQRVVSDANILGLLVPSPAKVFFEYGLIAGIVLAAFILLCYWGSPSRAFALTLLCSLWVLQTGITTIVFVTPLLALVSLWSPRIGPPIETILPLPRPDKVPAQSFDVAMRH